MSIISGQNQIDTHIAEGKFNESKSSPEIFFEWYHDIQQVKL